jgi:hypothetical protein
MWSEELQQQTREFLEQYPAAAMKHFGDIKFGICMIKEGKYLVLARSSDEKWEYDTIEEMIEDGWAID